MRRREFITLLGSAATTWPVVARAQQSNSVRRIGVLTTFAESDSDLQIWDAAFRKRLAELGWTSGRNVRLDYRWADGNVDRLRTFAKELVDLQPDVIFAVTTVSVSTLLTLTHSIPIVFSAVSDPVGSGFVVSLARPDGNVTGFTNNQASLAGKWVELLKELAPAVSRIAIMFNPATAPYAEFYLAPFEFAARSLRVEPIVARIKDARDIEQVVASLGLEPGGGLIAMPDTSMAVNRELIVSLTVRNRLPAIYSARYYAMSGGLASYGVDYPDLWLRAASYVDRLLRGEKPSNLPVQAPAKFQLVINLNTAKALGLEISPTLLARADEVIE